MKRITNDGGKQSQTEPLPEFADELTTAERQELSDMIAEAKERLTPMDRARESALVNKMADGNKLSGVKRDTLTEIRRKAKSTGAKELMARAVARHRWMVFAKSSVWRNWKTRELWPLSQVVFLLEGWIPPPPLGTFPTKGAPWHERWCRLDEAIRAEVLEAVPGRDFGSVRDWDIKPVDLLTYLRNKGFDLDPALSDLLDVGTPVQRNNTIQGKSSDRPRTRVRMDQPAHDLAAAVWAILGNPNIRKKCVDNNDKPVVAKLDRYLQQSANFYFPDRLGDLPIEDQRSREKQLKKAVEAHERIRAVLEGHA